MGNFQYSFANGIEDVSKAVFGDMTTTLLSQVISVNIDCRLQSNMSFTIVLNNAWSVIFNGIIFKCYLIYNLFNWHCDVDLNERRWS